MWEDDDNWLTPSKDASTQSEKFDIETFLSDLKLSDSASTLSRKIAKAQQRRALKQKLTSVEEEDKSSSLTPPIDDSREDMGASLSSGDNTTLPCEISSKDFISASDRFKNLHSTSLQTTGRMTSTPRTETSEEMLFDFLSPIRNGDSAALSDEEEEFEDAPDHFSEEAMERISMSASFSTIEALLSRKEDEDGQSLIRTPMTQSLVKVEEEEIPRMDISATPPRNTRSASVSPRPLMETPLSSFNGNVNNNSSKITSNTDKPRLSARNGLERRSLGSAQSILKGSRSQTRSVHNSVGFSRLSTPVNGRQSRSPRSAKPVTKASPTPLLIETTRNASHGSSFNSMETPVSLRTTLNLHADLATLDDITRRQEEMLRQEVMQQQQAERKNSWQGETSSLSSPNSSMGSLASSQSVDIGVLKKTLPISSSTPSRLRAPSKLPRPSGNFTTSPRVSTVIGTRGGASLEKSRSSADDECF